MKAYHGKQEIKDFYLARVQAHREADEIVKEIFWKNGKGDAIGCVIHGSYAEVYEKKLGISGPLPGLQDVIFQDLPNKLYKFWPEKFLDAINVGADLSEVWPKFAVWLLTDEKYGVINVANTDRQKKCIQLISDYYLDYKNISFKAWEEAIGAIYATVDDNYVSYHVYFAAYAAGAATAAYTSNFYAGHVIYAVGCLKNNIVERSEKLLELLRDCKSKE